jgi:hypothetical protein
MALTNKAYCSVDQVKAAMDSTTTANDDLIQSFISQAQGVIDSYLGITFQTDGTVAAPTTRTFDGNGNQQILIDRLLTLSSVKTQTYNIATDSGGSIVRTTNAPVDITGDCFLGPVGLPFGFIIDRENGTFPLGKRNVLVAGVYGYAALIPADIQRACIRIAIHFMKQLDANYQNTIGNNQFGLQLFNQDIPTDVCAILNKYRPRVFRGK